MSNIDKLYSEFNVSVRRCFAFTETEYAFSRPSVSKDSYGISLTRKNKTTGLTIRLEPGDCNIYISLSRLINNEIPKNPIFIDESTPIFKFDFIDLLSVQGVSGELLDGHYDCNDPKAIDGVLTKYANLLKRYGRDVLLGDFSIFNRLRLVVIQRINSSNK